MGIGLIIGGVWTALVVGFFAGALMSSGKDREKAARVAYLEKRLLAANRSHEEEKLRVRYYMGVAKNSARRIRESEELLESIGGQIREYAEERSDDSVPE